MHVEQEKLLENYLGVQGTFNPQQRATCSVVFVRNGAVTTVRTTSHGLTGRRRAGRSVGTAAAGVTVCSQASNSCEGFVLCVIMIIIKLTRGGVAEVRGAVGRLGPDLESYFPNRF